MNENLIRTTSSVTFPLVLGLSLSFGSSTVQADSALISEAELVAITSKYHKPPKFDHDIDIDQYIKENYSYDQPRQSKADHGSEIAEVNFFFLGQDFAEEQISLDAEFVDALNELASIEGKSSPTK